MGLHASNDRTRHQSSCLDSTPEIAVIADFRDDIQKPTSSSMERGVIVRSPRKLAGSRDGSLSFAADHRCPIPASKAGSAPSAIKYLPADVLIAALPSRPSRRSTTGSSKLTWASERDGPFVRRSRLPASLLVVGDGPHH